MDIKEKIELMTGLSTNDQKIVFDGKQLEDDKSLEQYQVKSKDVQLVRFGCRMDQTLQDAMKNKIDDSDTSKTLELYLPVASFQKRRCLLLDSTHLISNSPKNIVATIEKPPSFALLASISRKRSTLIQDFSENPTDLLQIKKEEKNPISNSNSKKKKKISSKSKSYSKTKGTRKVVSVFIHIESVGQTFQVDVTDMCTIERLISMATNAESNYMMLNFANSNLQENDLNIISKGGDLLEFQNDFIT